MRIRLYKKKEDQLLYFQFLSEKGNVYLDSQGYQSKDARSNGINSVKKNCVLDDRYDDLKVEGDFFYVLKAGNNTEIGRSEKFGSEEDRNTSKVEFIKEALKSSSSDDYSTNGRSDDYKPLGFYTAETSGVNGFESFEKEGEFYFVYNTNGGILLISEGYTSAKSRDNGISSVEKNMSIPKRYDIKQHQNGKHYFNLKAGNHQEIATSIWFNSNGDVQNVINQNTGSGIAGVGDMVGSNRMAVMDIEVAPVIAVADDKPKNKRNKLKKATPKGERVYLKKGSYHWNDVTYQTMKSTNDKFYFVFRNKEEKAVLLNSNVRGYNTEEEVDQAIEKVLKFGPNEANFLGKTTKNGKFYFHLNDENGKSIGKSFFYNEQDEMKSFAGLFLGEISVVATPAGISSEVGVVEKPKKVVDDYLPCSEYAGAEGVYKFEKDSEFYFAFNKNGKTVLRSEGYTSESGRDNGIASVEKNAPIESRWKQGVTEDGKHFTSLRAGNHQEIARSCYSDSAGAIVGFMAAFIPQPVMPEPEVIKVVEKEPKVVKVSKEVSEPEIIANGPYLSCEDYTGPNGYHKFFREDVSEYFFAFNKDDKTILRSEGFKKSSDRDAAIIVVKSNAKIEDRWIFAKDDDSQYYTLIDGEGNELAKGCPHRSAGALVGYMAAFMATPVLVAAALPEKEKVVVAPIVTPVAAVAATTVATPVVAPVAAGGCLKYWWLLLLLLLLLTLLYFNGCFGEKTALVGDIDSSTKVETIAETQPVKTEIKTPVVAEPEYTERRINILLPEINYDYNRSNILSEESPELNVVFDKMTKYKDIVVEVGSHTDVRGKTSYNKNLAINRAKEARNWLINKGIDGKRLIANGYGESSPRNKCKEGVSCTDDEHRVNRRTEFKIIKGTTFEIIREKKK